MPGRIVRKSTYEREYHELTEKTGIPFVPDAAWKDAVFAAASSFPSWPARSSSVPSVPAAARSHHHPDRTQARLRLPLDLRCTSLPARRPRNAGAARRAGPGIAGMLLLPLLRRRGAPLGAPARRRALVSVIALSLGIFTRLGTYTPWSPMMEAWTRRSRPDEYLRNRTPLERQGALVLQDKQCRNCHSLSGVGGQRGPALDTIASRMTEDQIIRQVLQGGGNMPAYGNALNPSETKALVSFLMTLRGHHLAPAVDPSRMLTTSSQLHQPPGLGKPARRRTP